MPLSLNPTTTTTTYTDDMIDDILDAKVDDTEMIDYALKTYVTDAVGVKQATLSAGTTVTNAQASLSGTKIKNIVPGTGISMTADANNITITGQAALSAGTTITNAQAILSGGK